MSGEGMREGYISAWVVFRSWALKFVVGGVVQVEELADSFAIGQRPIEGTEAKEPK